MTDPGFGRPYSPTDLDSPLISSLGHHVLYTTDAGGTASGVLSNVHEDGTATITEGDTVSAVVPAGNVTVVL